LVPGGNRCSSRLHSITSAVYSCVRLGATQEHKQHNSTGGITWTGEDNLRDLDFADDIALIADSWSSMQQITTDLITEASKVGLCTNLEKCKLMITNAWNERSYIQAAGSDIEKVDDFCYLGSYMSYNGSCEKDVGVRTGKATSVFGKMRRRGKTNVSV